MSGLSQWLTSDRPQVADTIHSGELWLRCPYCGDSRKNIDKAHLSVRLVDGAYHCYKCHTGGYLTTKERISYFGVGTIFSNSKPIKPNSYKEYLKIRDKLSIGQASNRKSVLERYNYWDDHLTQWDAFLAYDSSGNDVGVLLRNSGSQKAALYYGDKGISWSDASILNLESSHNAPVRVVEGPYDVLDTSYACVFGMITKGPLEKFLGHQVILVPDGDIWTEPLNLAIFKKLLFQIAYGWVKGPFVLGVEVIPQGLDPDECHEDDRKFVTIPELIEHFHHTRKPKLSLWTVKDNFKDW
ncbi:MAG: hypothetical protein JRE40_00345 [Deltaproteobacteria bacterium]|nr:hypothetical protein [Deltaproteobacteria bacterium]